MSELTTPGPSTPGPTAAPGAARRPASLTLVPKVDTRLTTKDFKSDQDVRWCPGCGDYAILAAFQAFLPELEVPRENVVIISGIGCSSRLPYYVDSYGMHSLHGRAPTDFSGAAGGAGRSQIRLHPPNVSEMRFKLC